MADTKTPSKTSVVHYDLIDGRDVYVVILDGRRYPCFWDDNGILVADTHDGRYMCVWG